MILTLIFTKIYVSLLYSDLTSFHPYIPHSLIFSYMSCSFFSRILALLGLQIRKLCNFSFSKYNIRDLNSSLSFPLFTFFWIIKPCVITLFHLFQVILKESLRGPRIYKFNFLILQPSFKVIFRYLLGTCTYSVHYSFRTCFRKNPLMTSVISVTYLISNSDFFLLITLFVNPTILRQIYILKKKGFLIYIPI